MDKFVWAISGTDGNGHRWETTGELKVENNDTFHSTVERALRDSFWQLTNGKAIYGNPGVGCKGPYKTNTMAITRVIKNASV